MGIVIFRGEITAFICCVFNPHFGYLSMGSSYSDSTLPSYSAPVLEGSIFNSNPWKGGREASSIYLPGVSSTPSGVGLSPGAPAGPVLLPPVIDAAGITGWTPESD